MAVSDEEKALVSAIDTTVWLERDLKRALFRDLSQIEPRLTLYLALAASGQQVAADVRQLSECLAEFGKSVVAFLSHPDGRSGADGK